MEYKVHTDVLERYKTAIKTPDDNVLVIINRRQGRKAIIGKLLQWLGDQGDPIRIAFVSTSKMRGEELLREVGPIKPCVTIEVLSHWRMSQGMDDDGIESDAFDLAIIDEAHYVRSSDLEYICDTCPYVGITCHNAHHPPHLPNLTETLDCRWKKGDTIIEANIPPWIDPIKLREDIFKRAHNLEYLQMVWEEL